MGVADGPSRWSIERFGPTLAAALWQRIPAALHRAVELARDAHEASELDTDHAFGPVRWKQQYEVLHEHLRDLPDVTDVHPPGAQVRVTVCRGHVLLPWRYAKRGNVDLASVHPGRDLGRLARDLLVLFGPEPAYREVPLPMMPVTPDESRERGPLREAVEGVAADPRVLLVGYAANSEDGLLRVSWGEAALARGDVLEWRHVEELPLSGEPSRGRPAPLG
ncbi:hypothetical protein [Micromonospora cathayae]|uniref:Uncharacterized protein n=1 Tax=Micromonospora cathayae TaxID=3028804 RepID=A0ABY7ZX98_9ACTN|nr:hypothetical protein [Micromonospora sp. HUAS 3]WDZ87078.1 hypothetical protein PVK37_12060 [Micromonospora sp. HUAS 3]